MARSNSAASHWAQRHARRRVVEICDPPRHETGPDARGWVGAERVAVMVHWSADGAVSRSVSRTVAELDRMGYLVAVCSTSESPGPLRWDHGRPDAVAVYRRPNIGIDFGTWSAMLSAFPALRGSTRVLLLNDSLLGPFTSLAPIIQRFEASPADVWGLVESNMMSLHFQSHFVGYQHGVLCDPPLRNFWTGVRLQPTKEAMIKRYEVGLYALLQRVGYRIGTGFPWQDVVANGRNPTIHGWRRLLDFGFPYVKRELLWKPHPQVTDADDVAAVVRAKFGEDVQSWV